MCVLELEVQTKQVTESIIFSKAKDSTVKICNFDGGGGGGGGRGRGKYGYANKYINRTTD